MNNKENTHNFKNIPSNELKTQELSNSMDEPFFNLTSVKEGKFPSEKEGVWKGQRVKDLVLRTRFQTLIKKAGLTNSQFYEQVGISRQYYYFLSWGLWDCGIDTKLKIAKILNCDSMLIWRGLE